MNRPHPAELRYFESPIPPAERRRVLWRDDTDCGRTATGVMVKRQYWLRGNLPRVLARVLVRLDSDPAGPLVPISPNDLEDIGPADALAPFPPVGMRPVFSVIQGGV